MSKAIDQPAQGSAPAAAATAPAAPVADGIRVLELRIPVRWGDMDAAAHVNNTVYLRYMEEARLAWTYALGVRNKIPGQAPILARIECDFKRPVTWPAELLVRQTVVRTGRTSVEHAVEMLQDGVLVASGRSVMVWMDYNTGQPTPWPEPQRSMFSV